MIDHIFPVFSLWFLTQPHCIIIEPVKQWHVYVNDRSLMGAFKNRHRLESVRTSNNIFARRMTYVPTEYTADGRALVT